MAMPAIADVRRHFPDAVIDVAARRSVLPLAELMPGIARAVEVAGRAATVKTLRDGRYDIVVLFPNSFNSAFTARRAGIPERWGYRHQGRGLLLTRAVWQPARVHQVAFYQHLTASLGIPAGSAVPRLEVSDAQRRRGIEMLVAHGWDRVTPLIAVAPGAAFGSAKRWPGDRFAAVMTSLATTTRASGGRGGTCAVLIGAPADVPAVNEVLGLAPGVNAINLAGQTTLTELAAVLSESRHLVTNDSGAMHLAAALGVNVTAVFGPTNEDETSPRGSGHLRVVHSDVWCRPCVLRECPLTHRCMRRIEPDAVLASVKANL